MESYDAWPDDQVLTPEAFEAKLGEEIIIDKAESGDWMETARDEDDSWWIADWEIMDIDGQPYWRSTGGYRIDKAVVTRLAQVQTGLLMHHKSPKGDYRAARGAIPYDPARPKPEVLIRRQRDAW